MREPDTLHNTDEEGNVDVEENVDDGVYYFTSGTAPTDDTGIYKSLKIFAMALLDKKNTMKADPYCLFTVRHKQVMKLEDVIPCQFLFGTGGPISANKRR